MVEIVVPRAVEFIPASLGAALRYAIVIRKRNDITTRHRFIDGVRTYRIIAVRESADRHFLEIDAEERED